MSCLLCSEPVRRGKNRAAFPDCEHAVHTRCYALAFTEGRAGCPTCAPEVGPLSAAAVDATQAYLGELARRFHCRLGSAAEYRAAQVRGKATPDPEVPTLFEDGLPDLVELEMQGIGPELLVEYQPRSRPLLRWAELWKRFTFERLHAFGLRWQHIEQLDVRLKDLRPSAITAEQLRAFGLTAAGLKRVALRRANARSEGWTWARLREAGIRLQELAEDWNLAEPPRLPDPEVLAEWMREEGLEVVDSDASESASEPETKPEAKPLPRSKKPRSKPRSKSGISVL